MSNFVLTGPDVLPRVDDFVAREQIVLILCGLIASGKSTFAQALEEHYPQFRRCNQDDLGDRRLVEQLARQSLSEGKSVCIDRTNFNAAQRSYWIEIAREFTGTNIWVIVFDTPYDICAARLRHRTSHPTIKDPEHGLSVLARFAGDYVAPAPHEGFDRILYLTPLDHTTPEYTRADISAILHKVSNAPSPTPARDGWTQVNPRARGRGQPHNRGYYQRDWRGRGSYSPRGRGTNFNATTQPGNSGWRNPRGRDHGMRAQGSYQQPYQSVSGSQPSEIRPRESRPAQDTTGV